MQLSLATRSVFRLYFEKLAQCFWKIDPREFAQMSKYRDHKNFPQFCEIFLELDQMQDL